MIARHLVIRPQAAWDIDDQAEYLMVEASMAAGSPWESERLTGVRFRLVERFKNHMIFYRMTDDSVEIVRVLHGSRNLEQCMRAFDE